MAYQKQTQTQVASTKENPVQLLKQMTKQGSAMYNSFYEVMKEKTPQFLASVLNAVGNNTQLQQCDPKSILKCAMQSASLNLDVNPNLGMAAIVPYGGIPQFQIQWKGFTQLALRSGQYTALNCDIIFSDEFKGRNLITGEVRIEEVQDGFRSKFVSAGSFEEAKEAGVAGVVFYFSLINGFTKTEYWTLEQCRQHGKAFSKSYQYDLRSGKKSSVWSTNFLAMAKKTVVKNTLSKYGPLSIEMQQAMVSDQQGYNPKTGEMEYVDNQSDAIPQEEAKPTKGAGGLRSFMNASEAEEAVVSPSEPENALQKQETASEDDLSDVFGQEDDYGDVESIF